MNTIQPVNTIPQTLEAVQIKSSGTKVRPASSGTIEARVETSTSANSPQVNLEAISRELNQFAERMGAELSFSVDSELNRVVMTVTRSGGDEVVFQIPSKEMLDLSRRLKEMEQRGDAKGALLGMMG